MLTMLAMFWLSVAQNEPCCRKKGRCNDWAAKTVQTIPYFFPRNEIGPPKRA
jgi:hypothetical protein